MAVKIIRVIVPDETFFVSDPTFQVLAIMDAAVDTATAIPVSYGKLPVGGRCRCSHPAEVFVPLNAVACLPVGRYVLTSGSAASISKSRLDSESAEA
jgi:hypothetical protein